MYSNTKTILIVLMLCASQSSSLGSATIDSLYTLIDKTSDSKTLSSIYEQIYSEKYKQNDKSEIESIVRLCRKHATVSNDISTIIKAEHLQGRLLYWQNKYKESYAHSVKVERQAKAANLPLVQARLLGFMSDIQGLLGNYVVGLELAQSCLQLRLDHNESEAGIADSYANIANFHGAVNNVEQSTIYYRKAKDIYVRINEKLRASRMMMYMGLDRTIAGEYDKAKQLLTESLANFRAIKDENSIIEALSNLGSVEQNLGNYSKAQEFYNEAQAMCIELGKEFDLSVLYQRNAHLNIDQQNWHKAISYSNKAKFISSRIGDKESLRREYEYLYKGYKGIGKYDQAFENLEKYTVLNDSLSNSQTLSKLNKLETEFQNQKREAELLLLTEKHKTSQIRTKGLIMGILSLVGLFTVLAFAMKQRIKKKEIEKQKLDQELQFKNDELLLKKKELSAYALQIAQKNQILERIKTDVKEIKVKEQSSKSLQKIVNSIDLNQNDDQSWEGFRSRFLEVHEDFEIKAKTKHPNLTNNEMRFISLIKMNLSSKEIANILNISAEGIKKARYRLRKKLDLNPTDSLEELIQMI